MKCKYLAIRSKKNVKYCYCRLLKKEIDFSACKSCNNKEFKTYKQLQASKPITEYKFKKHKLTKHTEIPLKVKKEVWERDNHKCIFCGKEVPLFNANSHYIKRSHNGLGIPKNIMTNCDECHNKFDDSVLRKSMLIQARKHFKSKYKDWNEDDLIYKKWGN